MVEDEMLFGRYDKQIDYRDGKIAQIVEHRSESVIPSDPLDIELATDSLRDMIYEAIGGNYKKIAIEVEFSNKRIKLIRKNLSRRIDQ